MPLHFPASFKCLRVDATNTNANIYLFFLWIKKIVFKGHFKYIFYSKIMLNVTLRNTSM